MIKNILVNGIQVNNPKTFIQKLGNIASASVEFTDYQRGGASGQMLSRPLYRGMTINMEWFVKGDNLADFIAQRDRLVGYFQNSIADTNYLKTLGFQLDNGITKEIDVLFTTVSGDLTPSDIIHSTFSVSAVSEREFLTSNLIKTGDLILLDKGGMAVPMDVPMNMANAPKGDPLIAINAGNAIAYPIITVYGVFGSSFNIVNDTTGETLTFNDGVGSTDEIEIDFYNRTAIKNGTTSVLGKISGSWLYLATGTNQLRITSGNSNDTGHAIVVFRDSYRNI